MSSAVRPVDRKARFLRQCPDFLSIKFLIDAFEKVWSEVKADSYEDEEEEVGDRDGWCLWEARRPQLVEKVGAAYAERAGINLDHFPCPFSDVFVFYAWMAYWDDTDNPDSWLRKAHGWCGA